MTLAERKALLEADRFDLVIVGGGVAGALIAALLPALRVVMLEAGSNIEDPRRHGSSAEVDPGRLGAVKQWAGARLKTLKTPYRDSLGEIYAPFPDGSGDYLYGSGAPPKAFKSTYLRRTGGSTWHWQGSTPRLLPSDFRMATQFGVGVDWPLSYEDLEPWYTKAERELGVSGDHEAWDGFCGAHRSERFPMPPIWPSYSDRQLTAHIEGLIIDGRAVRVRATPQARNSQPYQDRPPCAGNSICIPLCPIGAKYDATVHVRRAVQQGAVLHAQCVATRVVASNGTVEGIEVALWDETGVERATVRGKWYVCAAHAIESARLLLESQLPNRSGMLGRNLMDHPTGQIIGMTPEPWYPFRGPPVTSGIDEWRDGPERAERAAWKSSLGNDGFGRFKDKAPEDVAKALMTAHGFGESFRSALEAFATRMFRMSYAVEQLPRPDNRLELGAEVDPLGVRRVHLFYTVDDYTRRAFAHARTTILRIFDQAGITEAQIDPSDYGGSGHILGTCRMGRVAEQAVVDRDGRWFGLDNLFVVGGATFPTIGTANPTLTIAALALRTASILASA